MLPWGRINTAPPRVAAIVTPNRLGRACVCAGALLLFVLWAVARSAPASADVAGPASVNIPKITTAPSLDPKADISAWKDTASVTLPWDVQHLRSSSESTVVHAAADGGYLYVRFDAKQREGLLAQQHTNNVGDGTDDEVWVDLWPNGNSGFYYQFAATSNGTRFQYSTENTAYAPTWESYGTSFDGGFTITMRIPLHVMRGKGGGGGAAWKVQFVRIVRSTGERQIWSWGQAQTNGDDVRYAGALTGLPTLAASRPQPRVGVYGLGAIGSSSSGLTTSRFGADFSLPVTSTASLYGTIHPDFSNVEIDQQTISPTAYQRIYTEVRPFFTQGANFYENFSCDVCPYMAQLYTPAIPTPRDGYAFEGKEGLIQLAGFDAVGDDRNDSAAALAYSTPDNHWTLSAQTVAANIPGITDHVDTTGVHYNDATHIDAFFNYGSDSGTNVLDGSQAQRYDGGGYYFTPTFGVGASMRKVGEYYDPVDGYVQHPDIAGYATFSNKVFLFSGNSKLQSIQFGGFLDRYHADTGALNQTDNALWLDFLTKSLIDLQGSIGSGYLATVSGVFTPVTQNGVSATWHSGTANNPGNNLNHGSSATPTTISFNTGRFGPGRLDSWFRSSTMRAGNRGTVTLEVDDTQQGLDTGRTNVQWLQRAAYNLATGSDSSLAIGVRRIVGTAPLVDPTQPQPYTNAYNLSFAYHRRTPHDELYVAYGDASQLITVPQWIVKWIHYFGAEKGT